MDSVLDSGHAWFLDKLVFGDRLEVFLVEGIRASEPTDVQIGEASIEGAFAIEVTPSSRHVVVVFEHVLTFQVTNESYAVPGEGESRTEGVLCRYQRSSFLDSVRASTLIDALRPGEWTHFGLLLADDIIDVASGSDPYIEVLDSQGRGRTLG